MILVDTSVWIDHFRRTNPRLQELLVVGMVIQHPMVTAELALGSMRNRVGTIGLLRQLPSVEVADESELLEFIEANKLFATGIGFVDANVLLSASQGENTAVWTHDKKLASQADRLNISMRPN